MNLSVTSSHLKCQLESFLLCLLLLNFLFILLFIIQQGDCGVWLCWCTVCMKNAMQKRALCSSSVFPIILIHIRVWLLLICRLSYENYLAWCIAIIFRFNVSAELSKFSFKRWKEKKFREVIIFQLRSVFFISFPTQVCIFRCLMNCWISW